jgi:hypothetical protein
MADRTPTMADGLLGWPGFGPGGSQRWRAQQLASGNVWYAPRSGFYLITGCAGGGAGGGSISGSGGGSGGGLINYPLYLPEGAGGVVAIGAGGTGVVDGTGNSGGMTTFGDVLIFTGGGGGGTTLPAVGSAGTVFGYWLKKYDPLVLSVSRNGIPGVGSRFAGYGADGILSISSGYSLINGLIVGSMSRGGPANGNSTSGFAGESFGAGGSGAFANGYAGGDGGDGVLIIAWVGAL